MSDIELVLKGSKEIENALERIHGAQGRGLHEKLSSVESRFPQDLIKDIRYVASVRNSLVPETDSDTLKDRVGFEALVKRILSELSGNNLSPLSSTNFDHAATSPGTAYVENCEVLVKSLRGEFGDDLPPDW